jgi:hypothetical protein
MVKPTGLNKELVVYRDKQLDSIVGHIEKAINQPVDRAEFKRNLQAFSGILRDTLHACAKTTATDRIDALMAIKDPKGEPILQGNRAWAEEIVTKNMPLGNICDAFMDFNAQILEKHRSYKQSRSQEAGGFTVDETNFEGMKGPPVDAELQKQIDAKLRKSPLRRTFEVTGNMLVVLGRMVNPFYMYGFYKRYQLLIDPLLVIPKTLLDMILFPIYTLESIPIVGGIIGIPMDFVGIMIDSSDLLFKLVAPFVPGVISTLLDLLKAIPIVGSVVSIVSIPLNFAMPIVQNLVSNLASIMGFFLAVARKNFTQAYFYALNFVPFLGSIMRLATRFLYTINRIIGYLNKTMDQVGMIKKLNAAFSENPRSMNDPLEFLQSFVLKNVGKSETIDKIARKIIPYAPAVSEFNKVVDSRRAEIIGAWPNEDIEPVGKTPEPVGVSSKGGRRVSKRRGRSVGRRSK